MTEKRGLMGEKKDFYYSSNNVKAFFLPVQTAMALQSIFKLIFSGPTLPGGPGGPWPPNF